MTFYKLIWLIFDHKSVFVFSEGGFMPFIFPTVQLTLNAPHFVMEFTSRETTTLMRSFIQP